MKLDYEKKSNEVFCITREFTEAIFFSGHKRICEWYPKADGNTDIEDRIGMCINFEEAESIIMKYRKGGIGPKEIKLILDNGVCEI